MCTVLLPPGDNPIAVNKYIIYHINVSVTQVPDQGIILLQSSSLYPCNPTSITRVVIRLHVFCFHNHWLYHKARIPELSNWQDGSVSQYNFPCSTSVTALCMSVLLAMGWYSELQKTSALVPKLILDWQNYTTTGSVLFQGKCLSCFLLTMYNDFKSGQ